MKLTTSTVLALGAALKLYLAVLLIPTPLPPSATPDGLQVAYHCATRAHDYRTLAVVHLMDR